MGIKRGIKEIRRRRKEEIKRGRIEMVYRREIGDKERVIRACAVELSATLWSSDLITLGLEYIPPKHKALLGVIKPETEGIRLFFLSLWQRADEADSNTDLCAM